MRIYTNLQKVKNNRRIAQVLFFFSLVVLVGGLILTNVVGRNETLLLAVPCLVMPIGLATTWISVRLTNQYIRQPHPEDALQAALKGVNQSSVMYNYLFKANHVLVSTDGVFAFTTRFQDGPIRILGDKIIDFRARGPFGRFLSFMRQEQMGRPFEDARAAADLLQPAVEAAAPGVEVQPVIAFTSLKLKIDVDEPPIPIVVTRKDREPSMKTFRRDHKRQHGQLTLDQVAAIEKALNAQLSIVGAGEEQTETVADAE